jgi:aminoglycoside 3-N-acetyltransferase
MDLKEAGYPFPVPSEFAARCAMWTRDRVGPSRKSSASISPLKSAGNERASTVLRPIGRLELESALSTLGIQCGDVLMVHSSARAISALGWQPSDFIDFLQDVLGPDGTLAMPSHPALIVDDGRQIYDVRLSPSTVGLLTELFRRRHGARRSRYPFSAAAAIGPHAVELTSSHAASFAPHDEYSPYAKLAELNGKALCIGAHLDRMTLLHVAEDVLRNQLPIREFYCDREVWVRADGAETRTVAHVRAPWLWWYLCLSRWTNDMYRKGFAHSLLLSGVRLRTAAARPTVEWMKDDLLRGRTIYPLAGLNRWLHLNDPGLSPRGASRVR